MIFLLPLLLTSLSFAMTDCELFKGRACVYLPENEVAPVLLHIYHRGHVDGRRDFPAYERIASAKQALTSKNYKLISTADKTKSVVIASGSSAISFDLEDLEALENKYQLKFSEITFSSHSGGYWGLNLTLKSFVSEMHKVKQILMLDNFYDTTEVGLLEVLRKYTEASIPCLGFMTEHNAERVKKYYSFCQVEGPNGMIHDYSVGPFLDKNL